LSGKLTSTYRNLGAHFILKLKNAAATYTYLHFDLFLTGANAFRTEEISQRNRKLLKLLQPSQPSHNGPETIHAICFKIVDVHLSMSVIPSNIDRRLCFHMTGS
jgi:hypothetical protein